MFLNVKLFKDIFVMFKLFDHPEISKTFVSVLFLFPGFRREKLVIYVWKMIYRYLRM